LEGADDAETVSFVVESDNAGRDTSEIVIPVDARSDGSDPPSDFPGSDELFDLIDKDGDGEITPAEMSQAVGEFLQNGTVEGNNVSPGEMSQVVGWFLSQ
jgi:Ca2+-binding EF-hand superfamily protein